jgi:glycine C-acetyltransferase
MYGTVKDELAATLQEIEDAGLYKNERELTSPQSAHVTTLKAEAINFCANNYLGLADDPSIIESSKKALDEWGFGMASVRFICGTQRQHTDLERRIADFLGMEAAILYSSCFDANGGVFEVLFGAEDAIISDELNHASIIDGIRLSKAMRYRYKNADLGDLRAQLEAAVAAGAKRKVVVTDGVFSMDGSYAPLEGICDLADEFGALVFVDDSHAVGFIGAGGRGTPEFFGVMDRIDIITGTLGKALGGASGGYVASHREVVDLLRQRSRPYLFSNSVAPPVVAGSMRALELIESSGEKREVLRRNTELFNRLMTEAGFELLPGSHPIRPVMFPGEDGARRATEIADHMLGNGVYVIAFSYPVVPRGKARIRVQLSAAHSEDDVRACVDAFVAARDAVG